MDVEDEFGNLYSDQGTQTENDRPLSLPGIGPAHDGEDADEAFMYYWAARHHLKPAASLPKPPGVSNYVPPRAEFQLGVQDSEEEDEELLLFGKPNECVPEGLQVAKASSPRPANDDSVKVPLDPGRIHHVANSKAIDHLEEDILEFEQLEKDKRAAKNGLVSVEMGSHKATVGFGAVLLLKEAPRSVLFHTSESLHHAERSPDVDDFTNHAAVIPGLSTKPIMSSFVVADDDDGLGDDWEGLEGGRQHLAGGTVITGEEAWDGREDARQHFRGGKVSIAGGGEADWDSDSEDDLQIVLNDDDHIYPQRGVHKNGDKQSEDEDEDLVIVTGDERLEDQEWADEQPLPAEVQAVSGDRLLPSGGDRQGGTLDERGQTLKGGGPGVGLSPGVSRFGYGSHGYISHHSQYKYVRPGATAVSGGAIASAGRVRSSRVTVSKGGAGRGDWNGAGRGSYGSQRMPQLPPWGSGTSCGFQYGFEFHLPTTKTVFDIDLDSFDEKPWRHPGVDITEFFNFDFNESTWKDYCKQLAQLRLEATMQRKIRVYESGRSEQEYDLDLPPELAAAAGIQEASGKSTLQRSSGPEGIAANAAAAGGGRGDMRGHVQAIPIGRAIQVEGGLGERRPSVDVRRPYFRESDAIVLVDVIEEEPPKAQCTDEVNQEDGEEEGQENKDHYLRVGPESETKGQPASWHQTKPTTEEREDSTKEAGLLPKTFDVIRTRPGFVTDFATTLHTGLGVQRGSLGGFSKSPAGSLGSTLVSRHKTPRPSTPPVRTLVEAIQETEKEHMDNTSAHQDSQGISENRNHGGSYSRKDMDSSERKNNPRCHSMDGKRSLQDENVHDCSAEKGSEEHRRSSSRDTLVLKVAPNELQHGAPQGISESIEYNGSSAKATGYSLERKHAPEGHVSKDCESSPKDENVDGISADQWSDEGRRCISRERLVKEEKFDEMQRGSPEHPPKRQRLSSQDDSYDLSKDAVNLLGGAKVYHARDSFVQEGAPDELQHAGSQKISEGREYQCSSDTKGAGSSERKHTPEGLVSMGCGRSSEDENMDDTLTDQESSEHRLSISRERLVQEEAHDEFQRGPEYPLKRQRLTSRDDSYAISKEDFNFLGTVKDDFLRKDSELSGQHFKQLFNGDEALHTGQHKSFSNTNEKDKHSDCEEDVLSQQKGSIWLARHEVERDASSHTDKIDEQHIGVKYQDVDKHRIKERAVDWHEKDGTHVRRKVSEDKVRRDYFEKESSQREKRHVMDLAELKKKRDEENRRRDRIVKGGFRPRERDGKLMNWGNVEDEQRSRRKKDDSRRRDRPEKEARGREQTEKERQATERGDLEQELHLRKQEDSRRDRIEDFRQSRSRDYTWRGVEDTRHHKEVFKDMHGRREKEDMHGRKEKDDKAGHADRSMRHTDAKSWPHLSRNENHIRERIRTASSSKDRSRGKQRHEEEHGKKKDRLEDHRANDCKGRPHYDRDEMPIQEWVMHEGKDLRCERSDHKHYQSSDDLRTPEDVRFGRQKLEMTRDTVSQSERNGSVFVFADEGSRHEQAYASEKNKIDDRQKHNQHKKVSRRSSKDPSSGEVWSYQTDLEVTVREKITELIKTEHHNSSPQGFFWKKENVLVGQRGSPEDDEPKNRGRSKLQSLISWKENETSGKLSSRIERLSEIDQHHVNDQQAFSGHQQAILASTARDDISRRNDASWHGKNKIWAADKKPREDLHSQVEETDRGSGQDKKQENAGKDEVALGNVDGQHAEDGQLFEPPSQKHHLDVVAKLEKRKERFKLPVAEDREFTRSLESENNQQADKMEVKQERPARKRRWGSG